MDEVQAILLICKYAEHIKYPKYISKAERPKFASYAKWAVKELIEYIVDSKDNPKWCMAPEYEIVIGCTNDFIKKMDEYAKANEQSSYQFTIASKVAKDILDVLYKHI